MSNTIPTYWILKQELEWNLFSHQMSNNTWQEKEEGPAHPVMLLLKPKKDAWVPADAIQQTHLLQWAFVDIGHRIDGHLCTYTGRATPGGSGPKRSVQRAGAHRSARKGFGTGKREEEGRWGIKRVRNRDKRKKKVGKRMQMVLGEGTYLDIESRAATER